MFSFDTMHLAFVLCASKLFNFSVAFTCLNHLPFAFTFTLSQISQICTDTKKTAEYESTKNQDVKLNSKFELSIC